MHVEEADIQPPSTVDQTDAGGDGGGSGGSSGAGVAVGATVGAAVGAAVGAQIVKMPSWSAQQPGLPFLMVIKQWSQPAEHGAYSAPPTTSAGPSSR